MPLRKIGEPRKDRERDCRHPEHDPPGMIVLSPGTYEYTCPGCGRVVTFVVPEGPRMLGQKDGPFGRTDLTRPGPRGEPGDLWSRKS